MQALNMGRSLGFDAYQQYSPLLMPQMLGSTAAAGSTAPTAAQQQAGSSGVPAAAQLEDLAARVGNEPTLGPRCGRMRSQLLQREPP
jgi:hypothetical protein